MGELKRDCILYNAERKRCNGLKEMLCVKRETCPFYKSCRLYHKDGRKRKYPLEV